MTTTWTVPSGVAKDVFRASLATCTSGDESAPSNPAKASASVAAAGGITEGDTLVLGGVTYTAHASLNTGYNFSIAGNEAADATNLAAAINRHTTTLENGSAGHGCTASANTTTVTITYHDYGTAGNAVTITETGSSMTITTTGTGTLGGGVALPEDANVGLDLFNISGFIVYAEAAGAMNAGAFIKAYLYNPYTLRWSPCPDLNITTTAIQYESYAGSEVVGDAGRIAFLPYGLGRAVNIYVVGQRERRQA
jgi:hypothetical protein